MSLVKEMCEEKYCNEDGKRELFVDWMYDNFQYRVVFYMGKEVKIGIANINGCLSKLGRVGFFLENKKLFCFCSSFAFIAVCAFQSRLYIHPNLSCHRHQILCFNSSVGYWT